MDDKELSATIASGDKAALRQAYEAYGRELFMFALTLTGGNESDAEDVLQECFIAVWRNRRRVKSVGNLRGYLFTALRNVFLNFRRTESREIKRRANAAGPARLIAEGPLDCKAKEINDALNTLPEEQKQIVVLRVWGRLTLSEAARALDISENTAASRYRYALNKLRQRLGDL